MKKYFIGIMVVLLQTMAFAQSTVWLPSVQRTTTKITYTFNVKAPDYLADWLLKMPGAPGAGDAVQKQSGGKTYPLIKKTLTWDLGGAYPAATGQIGFKSSPTDNNVKWAHNQNLKNETAVINALNSAVLPMDGNWKLAQTYALIWSESSAPNLTFTEDIPMIDQLKFRRGELAKTTKNGKFYPGIKIPNDVEGYRKAMLDIVNLGRKNLDYRVGKREANNLRGTTTVTINGRREGVYHNGGNPPVFRDLILDEHLNDLAQIQAEWAASTNYMGHDGPPNYNGKNLKSFGARIDHFTPGFISAGEAGGWDTSPEGWMDSETHYRPWFSINHDVMYVGFGAAIGKDGKMRTFGVAASTRPHTAKANSISHTIDLPLKPGQSLEKEKKYYSQDKKTYLQVDKDGYLKLLIDRSREPVKENDTYLWGLATSPLKINGWQVTAYKISNDGFLQAVDANNQVLWTAPKSKPKLDEKGFSQEPIVLTAGGGSTVTSTPSASTAKSTFNKKSALKSLETLQSNEALVSANGAYMFCSAANDGNFAVYGVVGGEPKNFMWGTYQSMKYTLGANYKMILGDDGNLCVLNANNGFLWGSFQQKRYNLSKSTTYNLILTNQGKLNIVNASGQVLWTN
jgi:hypothetical protein